MLCTRQYNNHWPLTLHLLRRLNRFNLLFAVGDIAKYRLNHRHPMAIHISAIVTIYPVSHSVSVGRLAFRLNDKRHLSTVPSAGIHRRRIAHALLFERTAATIAQLAFKKRHRIAVTIHDFRF